MIASQCFILYFAHVLIRTRFITHHFHVTLIFSDECQAKGRLAEFEGTDVYCHRNCLRYPSTCPKEECDCYNSEQKEAAEMKQGKDKEGWPDDLYR
jgi:hypothetical protein